jgi:hypothetical protein
MAVKRTPKTLKKPGRKGHVVTERTRKQVMDLISLGLTQAQISMGMGISDVTLRKHYRHELNVGEVEMLANVSRNLHNIALDRDDPRSATAAIFIMKTRAGWRETSRTEVTGPGGGSIKLEAVPTTVNPRLLSPEERDSLRLIAQKALEVMDRAEMDEDEDVIDGEELEG